mgnify:FL=1
MLATKRFGGIFDYDHKKQQLEEVIRLAEDPNLWKDTQQARKVNQERHSLQRVLGAIDEVEQGYEEAILLLEVALETEDEEAVNDIEQQVAVIENKLAALEFNRMFNQEADSNHCFIDIVAGAGGTEAEDWAAMLLRMYIRYADRKGFVVEVLEEAEGAVVGINHATVKVEGDYAYGYLRTETGIHRLVRHSPFDAANKRHTSFASVFVYPQVDDHIDISINPADLKIDTYRASGAGGQHINKTDSAIRITHLPTNTVVQCQNDRSQHRNRDEAMQMLKSKLYEQELRRRREEQQSLENSKAEIGWGHQIRSYVFDQSRIKDLRTGYETGNIKAVMDGELDQFIEESLKQGV